MVLAGLAVAGVQAGVSGAHPSCHVSIALPDLPPRSHLLLALAHDHAQLRRSEGAYGVGSPARHCRYCLRPDCDLGSGTVDGVIASWRLGYITLRNRPAVSGCG